MRYAPAGFIQAGVDRKDASLVEASIVNNRRILSVGYGYDSEVIGQVAVTHQTTYEEVHALVRPLIQQYLANNNQERVQELLDNYSMMDSSGAVVDAVDAKVSMCVCVCRLVEESCSVL